MFKLSPRVNIVERELDSRIQQLSNSVAYTVGVSNWGAVRQRIDISSERDLLIKTGKPDNSTALSFFVAADFLRYSNNLRFIRVIGDRARNSTSAPVSGIPNPPAEIQDESFTGAVSFNSMGMVEYQFYQSSPYPVVEIEPGLSVGINLLSVVMREQPEVLEIDPITAVVSLTSITLKNILIPYSTEPENVGAAVSFNSMSLKDILIAREETDNMQGGVTFLGIDLKFSLISYVYSEQDNLISGIEFLGATLT